MGGKFKIRLFGPFRIEDVNGAPIKIVASKIRILIAVLITAPHGTHTRRYVQDLLWPLSDLNGQQSSLRQSLSSLRKILGQDFPYLFKVTNKEITINQERIEILGARRDGDFLEGLDLPELGFLSESKLSDWLAKRRAQSASNILVLPSEIEAQLKPTIAVVPLASVSAQEYESLTGDVFAMELSRILSHSEMLNVISHLSCRKFQLRSLDLGKIKEQLNANYLICGTVSQRDERVCVTADFIDLSNEEIKWSQKFQFGHEAFLRGDVAPAFELAEEIGKTVLNASLAKTNQIPIPSIQSHDLLMAAVYLMHRQELGAFSKSKSLLNELIKREPKNSVFLSWLAKWYVLNLHSNWSVDAVADKDTALACSRRALFANPACSFSLAINGLVISNFSDAPDQAFEKLDQAISIDSSNSLAWLLKGVAHAFTGQGRRATETTTKARALSPIDPYKYYYDCLTATSLLTAGDYKNAERYAASSLALNNRHTSTLRALTIAQAFRGKISEAESNAKRLRLLDPEFTIEKYLSFHPAAKFQTGKDWADALAQAGIPKT